MDLVARADYLANLVTLLDYFEDTGLGVSNKWVVKEFEAANKEFLEALKDKHDETRQSESRRSSGLQAGANPEEGQPRSGGSNGGNAGQTAGGGTPLRRPGV